VPGNDLSAVPGLQEAHRRALAGKLGITSLAALADADQRAIYTALGSLRPRPTLARIAAWQADARGRLSDAAVEASEWHRAASFAVIFAQRQVAGGWERRIEAEQTEVDPEPPAREWPGWECAPLCDWMLSQLDRPEHEPAAETEPAAGDATAGDATAAARAAAARAAAARAAAGGAGAAGAAAPAGRAELRIDRAVITDAQQTLDLVRGGDVVTLPAAEFTPPAQLSVTVTGGRSGQQLRAAVWFRRPAEPGWSPVPSASLPTSGQVEFALSSVPPGQHQVRLLAWATQPGASLAAVTLPRLTFRADPE
jgi:hypothetical protein